MTNVVPLSARSFTTSSQRWILGLMLSLFVFFCAFYEIKEVDTPWHLKYGETIWKEKRLLWEDTYSYTAQGRIYPPTHWLYQVGLHLVYTSLGTAGIIVLKAFWYAFLYLFLYLLLVRFSIHPILAFACVLGAAWASTYRLTLRPEAVSLLFFLFYWAILLRYRVEKNEKLLLLLPCMMVLWVNCHAGCIFGLGLLGIFCAGESLKALLARRWQTFQEPAHLAQRPLENLWATFAAVALSSLASPSFTMLYTYLFEHLDIYERLKVEEFKAPSFLGFLGFWVFAALLFVFWIVRYRKLDLSITLATLVFFYLGATSVRMLPYFLILAAYEIARQGQGLYDEKTYLQALVNRFLVRYKAFLFPVLLLLLATGFTSYFMARPFYQIGFGFDRFIFPADAVKYLKKHPIPGRMYNSNSIGGYLIWAYGEKQVYSDGRMQLYNDILTKDVRRVLEEDYNPLYQNPSHKKLEKGIWFCVCNYHSFPDSLPKDLWALVYFDESVHIYVRRPPLSSPDIPQDAGKFYDEIRNYIARHEFEALEVRGKKIEAMSAQEYYAISPANISPELSKNYNLLVLQEWMKTIGQNPNNILAWIEMVSWIEKNKAEYRNSIQEKLSQLAKDLAQDPSLPFIFLDKIQEIQSSLASP